MKSYRVRYLMSNHWRFQELPQPVAGRNLMEISERINEEIQRIVGSQPVVTIKLECEQSAAN